MSRKIIYRCNQKQNVLWIRAAVGRDQDTPLLIVATQNKNHSDPQ